MRKILAAALAASLMAATGAQAQERGPVEVVKDVMRLELWLLAAVDPGADGPLSEAALRDFFVPEFWWAYSGLMQRQNELSEPLLDGDPLTGQQEHCPLRALDFSETMGNQTVRLVTATFESQWCFADAGDLARELTAVEFLVVQRDDGWRIEDFRTINMIPNDDGTALLRYVMPSFRGFVARQLEENPAPAAPPAA